MAEAQEFTIRFREIVTYEKKVMAEGLAGLSGHMHAVYEEGDFHPIHHFSSADEREIIEVLDAKGETVRTGGVAWNANYLDVPEQIEAVLVRHGYTFDSSHSDTHEVSFEGEREIGTDSLYTYATVDVEGIHVTLTTEDAEAASAGHALTPGIEANSEGFAFSLAGYDPDALEARLDTLWTEAGACLASVATP